MPSGVPATLRQDAGLRQGAAENAPFASLRLFGDDRNGALIHVDPGRVVSRGTRLLAVGRERRRDAERRSEDEQHHEHPSHANLLSAPRSYWPRVSASRYRFDCHELVRSCYNGGGVRGVRRFDPGLTATDLCTPSQVRLGRNKRPESSPNGPRRPSTTSARTCGNDRADQGQPRSSRRPTRCEDSSTTSRPGGSVKSPDSPRVL